MKIIGIGGGTGSGKTTLANKIIQIIPPGMGEIIRLDNYYKDRSNLPATEREKINYDDPEAIESDLLKRDLEKLLTGQKVKAPIYEFGTHTRSRKRLDIYPRQIIILEGIYALYYKPIIDIMDLKIYVDTQDDIRFTRRLTRDIQERHRTLESVLNQYYQTVKPMHDLYVEPCRKNADIIIPFARHNPKVIELFSMYIKGILNEEIKESKMA